MRLYRWHVLPKNPEAAGATDGLTHQSGDDVMLGAGRGDRQTETGREPMEDQHTLVMALTKMGPS